MQKYHLCQFFLKSFFLNLNTFKAKKKKKKIPAQGVSSKNFSQRNSVGAGRGVGGGVGGAGASLHPPAASPSPLQNPLSHARCSNPGGH